MTSQKLMQAFVAAIKREIEYWGIFFGPDLRLDTIYFGGGTPSLLAPAQVGEILDAIDGAFDTTRVKERSFELNPDDVDRSYLGELRGLGIDRLSIGIQSFFDDDLAWMNRAHSALESNAIVSMARDAGFENISVDLIFGIPGQPASNWTHNLMHAIELGLPHLSTYSLTVEPGTPLHKQMVRGTQRAISDAAMADLYLETIKMLRDAGYEHYEVSSFSKPDFRSRHNQSYWQHANYIGLGPSAHSFWRSAAMPATRWENVRNLKRYTQWDSRAAPPRSFEEEVSARDLASEYVMLRLRTRDGLDLGRLKSAYGARLSDRTLETLRDENMVEIDRTNTLRLTPAGLLVCDAVTEKLLDFELL